MERSTADRGVAAQAAAPEQVVDAQQYDDPAHLDAKPLDREELHARLRVADRILSLQTTVRQLEGLLPICSYCKKIRDESEHWSQVEEYVSRRTEATFSHGICPDCYERHLRPQLDEVTGGGSS